MPHRNIHSPRSVSLLPQTRVESSLYEEHGFPQLSQVVAEQGAAPATAAPHVVGNSVVIVGGCRSVLRYFFHHIPRMFHSQIKLNWFG